MISELKAQLSKYVGLVRNGETIIVRDRKVPVAKLVPYRKTEERLKLKQASLSPEKLRDLEPVPLLKPVDAVALLRRDRNGR